MNRGTLVAVVVLIVLVGVFFVSREDTPQYEESPLTVKKVEGLSRIEIEPPSGGQGDSEEDSAKDGASERIVLEKREDEWWLVEPVESPTSDSTVRTIESELASTFDSDDLQIDASEENKKNYDLQEGTRARIRLYGAESDEPAVDLYVGKQISVDQTDAERTFLQEPGGDQIYRGSAAIGEFVRQSADEFRSKSISDFSKDDVTRVEWQYEDGLTMVLEREEESWKLVRPQVEWELDESAVDGVTGSLATMTAAGFADDSEPSEVGLEPPTAVLKASVGSKSGDDAGGEGGEDRTVEFLVGSTEAGDDSATYYVKRADKPYMYEVPKFDGTKLLSRLGDLRSKTPRAFDREALTEVRFAGEESVVVRKEDGNWTLVEPELDEELNESKLNSRLSAVASLEVAGFPGISAGEAGLGPGADRLTFRTEEGGEQMILIGDEVDEESGHRYVKFGDGDEVYTVAKRNVDKLSPAGDDLVGEAETPPGGAAGKGLPSKGMGGMKQKQILKQLKQKMGK